MMLPASLVPPDLVYLTWVDTVLAPVEEPKEDHEDGVPENTTKFMCGDGCARAFCAVRAFILSARRVGWPRALGS